jgi:L-alanine-DL-glutamate epimerase-like enolase superfamily enzyme
MMTSVIDAITIAEERGAPGDDTCFVGLRGAGTIGWYGPVDAAVGRWVQNRLAVAAVGLPFEDHHYLHAALRHAVGANPEPVASWAVGAVDCAAWDLHGQAVHTSVAGLLAPMPQQQVPLYASWLALDLTMPTSARRIAGVGDDGWQFTKWGLRTQPLYGVRSEAARLATTADTVAAVLGQPAAFDAVFTWDTTVSNHFADQVDPAALLWLEDPLHDHNLESYRLLAGRIPIAIGERLFIGGDGSTLLGLRPRAFTVDVVACGGLTRAVELVQAARARGVPIYPHGRSFVPAVHLAAAFPDAIPAVEYRLQWEPARQRRYADPWVPAHGAVAIPGSSGLGAAPRSR